MSEREWRFYLDDMIAFAEKVLAYSEGLDQKAFIAKGLNYGDRAIWNCLARPPRISRPNSAMPILQYPGGRLSQPATG
jgi:hypothetical protein